MVASRSDRNDDWLEAILQQRWGLLLAAVFVEIILAKKSGGKANVAERPRLGFNSASGVPTWGA